MAAYSDINGFPEAGFPVLSDVSDRVCLNTLYWNPLKEAGFILDVVGNNRLAGNLSLAGMLSGVTSITMNGALSGVSTITANGTATLTSSNPLSLTDVNANIRMPGLNSSIGSVLERVYKGYFKNLNVANTLTVNGDDVALIGDIQRYVSGTLNYLPKYNATGITDSKFTDDGTTPKYNANIIWHAGISNLPTVDWTAKDLYIYGDSLAQITKSNFFYNTNFGIGTPDSDGLQIFAGDVIRFGKRATGVFTEWARFNTAGNLKIGTLSGYLKGTSGVVGAVSSIPESDISFTDIVTNNSSVTKHGYLPKLSGSITDYFRGDGSWGAGASPGGSATQLQFNDGTFGGIARLTYDKVNVVLETSLPVKIRDIAVTPVAPLYTGSATAVNSLYIEDNTKSFTVNELVGKAILLDSDFSKSGVITSNTSIRINVTGFGVTPSIANTYKIITPTTVLSSQLNSVVSIVKNTYDHIVALPDVSSAYNRCELDINLDGNTDTGTMVVVIPYDNSTYFSDWYTPNNKRFGVISTNTSAYIKIKSHNFSTKHWDVISYYNTSYT